MLIPALYVRSADLAGAVRPAGPGAGTSVRVAGRGEGDAAYPPAMSTHAGRLHVIAGPMFAGKTEELIRRLHRVRLAGRSVAVFSHSVDTRGGFSQLHTHSGASLPAQMAADVSQLRALLGAEADHLGHGGLPAELVAIDEAQFFGPELPALVMDLLRLGADVELAGLCVTFDGEPFEPLPSLMALADRVTKLTAVCEVCGADAPFHIRRPTAGPSGARPGDTRLARAEHVGGIESYSARCRTHHQPA